MKQQRISPAGFDRVQRELLSAENKGYGPDDCARRALTAVGLPHEPTEFIVDYSLSGSVFPFGESLSAIESNATKEYWRYMDIRFGRRI